MNYADVEKHCLSLPGATLSIQWGEDRVLKVGGKMFAVIGVMDQTFHGMSFKAADDSFHILTKLRSISPAPYLARAKWVRLESPRALPARDLRAYLTRAHAIVAAKLPKKTRAKLGIGE
jgi:predicted DNA-binding protein (MmcQ/YjbR family)